MAKKLLVKSEGHLDKKDDLLDALLNTELVKQKLLYKYRKPERISKERALIFSALLLFCFSSIIQLSTLSTHTKSLQLAVNCFSVAIPLLCVAALFENWQFLYRGYRYFHPKYPFASIFFIVEMSAILIATIGIGSIFFHFSPVTGVLFTVTTFIVSYVHKRWREDIEELTTYK